MALEVCETIAALRAALAALPRPVGLVPTMGYLHAGHLELVRHARAENPSVVATIFVNPTQFNRPDDLASYPRDLPRDLAMLTEGGVDLVFAPSITEVYPPGESTRVQVSQLSERLEGAHRPGHFDGVATVVSKLFNIVRPDVAYFGQKDAQQVLVIRQMVRDLFFPLEIRVVPTIREADGLALSSRNVKLNPEARAAAVTLSRALHAALTAWQAGERDADRLRAVANDVLATNPAVQPEYLSLAEIPTLAELTGQINGGLLSLAAWVGGVRLIDNVLLGNASLDSRP
jgi:pantoate--beta-alanine ligase